MTTNHKSTFIATLIGIPAAVIAGVLIWHLTDGLRQESTATTPAVTAEQAPTPTDTPSPVPDAPVPSRTDQVVAESAPPEPPSVLYLKDLSDDQIVKRPHWVWDSRGTASINGTSYLNSLVYEFQNCSNCDESLEFIVPAGYTTLTGTVGLSDQSRHDDVIDGVVNFAIYDVSGNQLFPTTQIEYPQAVPINLDISGQARIRINMSRGTNYEEFVLGDMALVRD